MLTESSKGTRYSPPKRATTLSEILVLTPPFANFRFYPPSAPTRLRERNVLSGRSSSSRTSRRTGGSKEMYVTLSHLSPAGSILPEALTPGLIRSASSLSLGRQSRLLRLRLYSPPDKCQLGLDRPSDPPYRFHLRHRRPSSARRKLHRRRPPNPPRPLRPRR